jgi:hypothetical protein
MVTGISTDRFEVGQPLGDDAYKRKVFSDLLSVLADSNLKIVGIDLTYTSSVKLQTNAGLIIQLGNGDALATKLSLADYAVSELFKQGKGTGTLDVSTGVNAYYREN